MSVATTAAPSKAVAMAVIPKQRVNYGNSNHNTFAMLVCFISKAQNTYILYTQRIVLFAQQWLIHLHRQQDDDDDDDDDDATVEAHNNSKNNNDDNNNNNNNHVDDDDDNNDDNST